jgi:hypothetical protein
MTNLEAARTAVVVAGAAVYAAHLAYTEGAYGTALSLADPATVATLTANYRAACNAEMIARAAWHAALDAAA